MKTHKPAKKQAHTQSAALLPSSTKSSTQTKKFASTSSTKTKKVGPLKSTKSIGLKKIQTPKQVAQVQQDQHDTLVQMQTIPQPSDESITVQRLNLEFREQSQVQLKTVTSDEFNFQIDDVAIGQGVHSKVYKTFDFDTKQHYAIKIVPASSHFIYQEIDLMTRLASHHDIIQLKKSFIMKEQSLDQVVLLMELGQFNLQEIIHFRKANNLRFNEDEMRFHALTLLKAYQAMKSLHIVHRDYKPSNIIYFAKDDQLKVGDFSEGKLINQDQPDQLHTVRGTGTFLDPDLFLAYSQNLQKLAYDPFASDLYSLGVTLICMALLELKIERNQMDQYLKQIQTYYSQDLHSLLEVLISPNTKQRQFYSSYLQFMKYKNELRKDYKVYLEMTQRIQKNDDFNIKFNKIISIVDGYLKIRQVNKALSKLKELQEECRQLNKEDFYAISLIKIAQIHCDQKQYDIAIQQGQLALNICQKMQSQVILGAILNTLGIAFSALSNYDEALLFYQKAEKIAIDKFGNESPELGDVYNNLGSLYYKQRNRKMAQIYFYKAYQIKKKGSDIDDILGLCDILNNLGIYFNEEKDYPLAEKYLEDAINLAKVYSKKTNTQLHQISSYINSLENIITTYTFDQKFNFAEQKLDEMEQLYKEIYKVEDYHYSDIYNKRGIMYAMMEDNVKAIVNFKLSINLLEDLNIEKLSLLDSYYNIAVLNYKMKYLNEAMFYCKKSLDLCESDENLEEHKLQLKCLYESILKVTT